MQARFYAPWFGRFLSPDPARDQHFEETQSWNIYSYVQNNPTMNIDPNGEELRPIGSESAIKQFNNALEYLKNDPGMASAIRTLQGSSTLYPVKLNESMPLQETGFNAGTGEIFWNPNAGSEVVDNNGNGTGEVQSPALVLGHELSHALGADQSMIGYLFRSFIKDKQYDDKEEKKVITGPERNAAKKLGEPTRDNHKGKHVPVDSSTSRKPAQPAQKKDESKK